MRYERDQESAIELVNLAFIKILKSLKGFDPKYAFDAWIKRIMVNEAIDHYRKKKREREVLELRDLTDDDSGRNHGSINEDTDWIETEHLESMMQCLTERQRLVFNLYAIDGYAHKEIAEILGISERSSIRNLGQAREQLQELFSTQQYGMKKA